MEIIEIRQSKKKLIPMLVLLGLALVGMIYFAFFSGKLDNQSIYKYVYLLATASLAYAIFTSVRKFIKNEPVLTITKSGIEINEKGKPDSLVWLQIRDWKIEQIEQNHYLIIETPEQERKIDISWLDKKPKEIEELIQMYKRK